MSDFDDIKRRLSMSTTMPAGTAVSGHKHDDLENEEKECDEDHDDDDHDHTSPTGGCCGCC